jgi:hypothetical protein
VPHLDPDRLVLIAVGDHLGDETESAHLDDCAACRDEVDGLRETAARATESSRVRDLPMPPERVWRRITSELTTLQPPAAPVPGSPVRPRRRRTELARLVLVAAVAAVLAAGGTLLATDLTAQQPEQVTVTARAVLTPLPAQPTTAQGEARVLDDRTLHLHVTGLERHPGYYEVWLINPDTMEMISVGVLGDDPEALLPLPPTVDLRAYRLVDISAEHYDNDPAHSGNSMVRGTLTS